MRTRGRSVGQPHEQVRVYLKDHPTQSLDSGPALGLRKRVLLQQFRIDRGQPSLRLLQPEVQRSPFVDHPLLPLTRLPSLLDVRRGGGGLATK